MTKNFMISLDNFRSGRVHTLITCAFSHNHHQLLIMDMIGLYLFGISIGRVFGPEFLLMLYLSGTVAGSVFFLDTMRLLSKHFRSKQMLGVDPASFTGLGARRGVNCVMLFDIFTHPRYNLYIEFAIPFPAILLGILIIRKDTLRIREGDFSGSSHLGGAAVASGTAIILALLRLLLNLNA